METGDLFWCYSKRLTQTMNTQKSLNLFAILQHNERTCKGKALSKFAFFRVPVNEKSMFIHYWILFAEFRRRWKRMASKASNIIDFILYIYYILLISICEITNLIEM
jgi:hypothetical protein